MDHTCPRRRDIYITFKVVQLVHQLRKRLRPRSQLNADGVATTQAAATDVQDKLSSLSARKELPNKVSKSRNHYHSKREQVAVSLTNRSLQSVAADIGVNDLLRTAKDDKKLLRFRKVPTFDHLTFHGVLHSIGLVDAALDILNEIGNVATKAHGDKPTFWSYKLDPSWSMDEKTHANLLYLLHCIRPCLEKAFVLRAWDFMQGKLQSGWNYPWRRLLRFGGDKWCAEFSNNQRPLSTTWPWSIRPSLAVIWGVCWMFHRPGLGGLSQGQMMGTSTGEFEWLWIIGNPGFRNSFPADDEKGGLYNYPAAANQQWQTSTAVRHRRHPEANFSVPQGLDAVRITSTPEAIQNPAFNLQAEHLSIKAQEHPASLQHHRQDYYQQSSLVPPVQQGIDFAAYGHSAVAEQAYNSAAYASTRDSLPYVFPFASQGSAVDTHLKSGTPDWSGATYSCASQSITSHPVTHTGTLDSSSPHPYIGDSAPQASPQTPFPQVSFWTSSSLPHSTAEMDAPAMSAEAAAALQAQPTPDVGPNDPRQISEDQLSSDGKDPFARRGFTHRRFMEEPPKNEMGKMTCRFTTTCGSITFDRRCEWNKHMDKHERPYKCEAPGCEKLQGFTYSGGLLRHQREVHKMHGGTKEPLYCPFHNCKRNSGAGFTRKENRDEHIRRVHRRATSASDGSAGAKRDREAMEADSLLHDAAAAAAAAHDEEDISENIDPATATVPKRRRVQLNGNNIDSSLDSEHDIKTTIKRLQQNNEFLIKENQNLRRDCQVLNERMNRLEENLGRQFGVPDQIRIA